MPIENMDKDEISDKGGSEGLVECIGENSCREGQVGNASDSSQLNASLAILINNAMFPIIIVDWEESIVLFINSYAEQYFRVPATEALGMKASEYWVYPEKRQAYLDLLQKNGQVIEFEAELLTDNKVRRHALLSATKIVYAGREAAYTVFVDISDRKRAEEALLQSEARYQELYRMMTLMANTVPDMLWAKDLDDTYLFANKAIREKLLLCDDNESPLGKNDLFFANRERAAGHQHTFGEICVNSDTVVKTSQQPGRFLEDGLVRGEYLVLDVHKAPLVDESGRMIGTVGAGRDVTKEMKNQKALEESEKRYRVLVENVRDVIWVANPLFHPQYVTPSIAELTGYSQEEFLEMPIEMHLSPEFRNKFSVIRRLTERMLRNKEEISDRFFECQCVKKDGTLYWVEIITSTLFNAQGELQGFTGVIRDATKRILGQKELEHAKQLAQAASQTKSEFLANMSHEIRTPMNGVLGILQLLKDTPLDSVQQKYIDTALASGTSLLKIISDILDFSKIEAGKVDLLAKPFVIDGLFRSVVESFASLVDRKLVTLRLTVAEDVPPVIIADESRLKQILFNLIGNAVKFTPHGEIAIDLKLIALLPDSRGVLECTIRDSGIGVSEMVVSRLFEPFFQEDGSFRRKYGGTGLGLSIVKNLVEMMGGTIHLESFVGKGTTVTFQVVVGIAAALNESDEISTPHSFKDVNCLRVLVVEDEKINAMVVSAMLKKLGHQVELAENGREALAKITKVDFDCIFMDIQMPEMDGVETTQVIREKRIRGKRKVPIIALTAHAMKGDKERFIAAGMDDYLSKPIEIEQLKILLHRHFS